LRRDGVVVDFPHVPESGELKMNWLKSFVRDENAAEVTELGIVLALIVAGCVATIALIGPKIQAAYTTTNAAIP
jgi:Flp pilus assembly pilin Flp